MPKDDKQPEFIRTIDGAAPRKGEVIGGGFFVFRRGKGKRIFITPLPYEHATIQSARKEAERLKEKNPENTYQVFEGRDVYQNPGENK